MQLTFRNRLKWLILSLIFIWTLLFVGTAAAAEILTDDIYELPADTKVDDDLYILASEVIIDGVVEGDLIVWANYVQINGRVTGDVFVLANGVSLTGQIRDDARIFTSSANITGEVGDDLIATGAGAGAISVPVDIGNRTLTQGIFLQNVEVGGDLILLGGLAEISGRVGGTLRGFINTVRLTDTTIENGTDFTLAEISADDASQVLGDFAYSSTAPLEIPESLTTNVIYNPPETETTNTFDPIATLARMVASLLGFAIVGWFILRYRPSLLYAPLEVIQQNPIRTAWTGFLIVLVPFLALLSFIVVAILWGGLASIAFSAFLICGVILIWTFSPMIVALWIGRRFSYQPFNALMIGCVLIVVFRQLPLIGGFISMIVFFIAAGSLMLARRTDEVIPQV